MDRVLTRVEEYRGETELVVAATQLDPPATAAERRRVLDDWVRFLATTPTAVTDLQFTTRLPQVLFDAVAGQPQLRALRVKWGPYADLSALGGLSELRELRLGGATGVLSLGPLRELGRLTDLTVSEAHKVDDVRTVGSLTSLETLTFGNAYPGSSKTVVLPDLTWVLPLRRLRSLSLPGTRLVTPDLSPLLELDGLEELWLPLRRQYRRQVFELAAVSPVFAQVAQHYTDYERWRASLPK